MSGWYSLELSKTERKVLDAIWGAPDKVVSSFTLERVMGLTSRGWRTVLNRMEDRSLLALKRDGDRHALGVTITFKGMQALGVTERDAA